MTDTYSRQLTTLWDADVVVVGSGTAGTCAAIAAARNGAKTTLVERFGFLGGTSTQVLDTFYGFYTPGSVAYKVVGGIPDEVVAALKGYQAAFERPNSFGAGTGITYDPSLLKIVWETMTLQAGVQILFHHDLIPGYENASLSWMSHPIGVRETRRIYGQYRLTREDCLSGRNLLDAVGACGAPIEDHHPGKDTAWVFLPEGMTYDIPYRSLIPQKVTGLLVAGRCFSATHDAHASCRSMAQTMTMGQAAGTAAALAVKMELLPHEIEVGVLQERLRQIGARFGEIRAESTTPG